MKSNRDLKILAALFVGIAGLFHLGSAVAGHSQFRDMHLGVALGYAEGSIDLFNPIIVGFNANGVRTGQELPLWQALAGLALKLFGGWFGWANLVSLLGYLTGLWAFLKIATRALGEARAGWWALVLYACQPLTVYLSGQAGTDMFCVGIMAWFVYFALEALERRRWAWWAAAATVGALCAISKLPVFMVAGIALFLVVLSGHRTDARSWAGLIGSGLFAIIVFSVWTRTTNSWFDDAEFPFIDLRVSENPYMKEWYFGTLAERLDPMIYVKSGWRFLACLVGSFAAVVFPIVGLFSKRGRFACFWLIGAAATTLVFFNLITVHHHYYMIFSFGVALAAGAGVVLAENAWRDRASSAGAGTIVRSAFVPLLAALLILSLAQGLVAMEIGKGYDPFRGKIVGLLQEHTSADDDKLIIWGGGWGGEELFLSDREGLSVETLELLKDPADLARLKELGFTVVVLISESPLIHSYQVTNPGSQGRVRETYHRALIPEVADWREVFSSEDLRILEIP